MSYNVTNSITLRSNATIAGSDVEILRGIDLPESNLIEEMLRKGPGEDGRFKIESFTWRGEWSGHSYELIESEIAPKVAGRIEVVLVWEGGDDITGFVIENGKFSARKVRLELCDEEGEP